MTLKSNNTSFKTRGPMIMKRIHVSRITITNVRLLKRSSRSSTRRWLRSFFGIKAKLCRSRIDGSIGYEGYGISNLN